MDLPSSFEWSTQESEVEEKEPTDRFLKFPNASQAGLKSPPPPPPSLAWMKIKCLWGARGEGREC